MGLFQRLGTLIKSNINDLITKAEDPEKMLSQVLVDMKNQLVEAKKQVAVAIGDEKRLKKQWDDQIAAGQGVGAQGHDGRARGRRRARQGGARAAEGARGSRRRSSSSSGTCRRTPSRSSRISCARSTTRSKRPSARRTSWSRAPSGPRRRRRSRRRWPGCRDTSAFDTFDRMAEKVEQIEAEAEAGVELAGELTGDTLQSRFKQLENDRRRRHGAAGAQGQDGARAGDDGATQGAARVEGSRRRRAEGEGSGRRRAQRRVAVHSARREATFTSAHNPLLG